MKSIKCLFIAAICLVATASYADKPVNFGIGGYWWSTFVEGGLSGNVDPELLSNNTEVRLDLNFDSFSTELENNSHVFAYLEFQDGYMPKPNIKLSHTALTNGGYDGNILIPNITNTGSGYSSSLYDIRYGEIDLSHSDISIYYRALKSAVWLDIGLTGRFIQGQFTLDYTDYDFIYEADISTNLVLLYSRAYLPLPFGFSLEATAIGGKNSSEKGLDITLLAQYKTPIGIAAGIGYRQFDATLVSEAATPLKEITTDLQFKGLFLQLAYHY